MSDNDDEYQMEYTSESDSEPDVDLENQVSSVTVSKMGQMLGNHH